MKPKRVVHLRPSPVIFSSRQQWETRRHTDARTIILHYPAAELRQRKRAGKRDSAGPWIGDRFLSSVFRRYFSSSKTLLHQQNAGNGMDGSNMAITRTKNKVVIEQQANTVTALERAVEAAARRAGTSKWKLKALVAEYMTPSSAIGMTVIQDPNEPSEQLDSIWASNPEWEQDEVGPPESANAQVARTDNRSPLRRVTDYLYKFELFLAKNMPSFDYVGQLGSRSRKLKPSSGYYEVIYHSEDLSAISDFLYQQIIRVDESNVGTVREHGAIQDLLRDAIDHTQGGEGNTFVEKVMSVLEFYAGDARLPEGYEKRLTAVQLRLQLIEPTISREDLVEAVRVLFRQEQPDIRLTELAVGHMCSHGMFNEIISLTLRLFDFTAAQEVIRSALLNRVANPNLAFANIFRACIASGKANFAKHLLAEISSEVDRAGRNFLADKYGPQDIQNLEAELMARAQLELALIKLEDKEMLQKLIADQDTRSFILNNESTFLITLLQLLRIGLYSDVISLIGESQFPDIAFAVQEISKRLPLFLLHNMVDDVFVEDFTLIAAIKLHDANTSCGCLAPIAQMANAKSIVRLWSAIVYCDPVAISSSSPIVYEGLPKNRELLTSDLVKAFGTQAMQLGKWDVCVRIVRTKTTGRVRSQIDPAFIASMVEKMLVEADNDTFSKLSEEVAIQYAGEVLASQVSDTARRAILLITERLLTGQVVVTKETIGQFMTLLMGTLQRAGYYVGNPYAANILALLKQTNTRVQEDIIERYGRLMIPTHLRQLVFEHIDRNRATGDYSENVIYAFIDQAIHHKTSTRSKVNSIVIATLKCMLRSERPTAPSRRNNIYATAPYTVENSDPEALSKRASHAIKLVSRLHREWRVGREITYWLLQCLILHRQFEPAIKAFRSTRKSMYPQQLLEIFQTTAIAAKRPDIAVQARYEELVRYDHQRRRFVECLLRMTYSLLEEDGLRGLQGDWGVRYWSAVLFRTIGKKDSTASFASSLIRGVFNDASRQLTSNLNDRDTRLSKASRQIVDDERFTHALDWTILSSANDWNFPFAVWRTRLDDLYNRASPRATEEDLEELTARHEILRERLRHYEELSLWWSNEFRLILKGPRRWARAHIEKALERSKRRS
ncbi:hypothetical protein POJ06DRAFT_262132 [Lipomyces tetrasporus]|uniref:Uncharacterized protein n=1 Tax=Lipomyces tetrasporus TaxID=54092 RepID=A0AAD7VPN0_9ASCO|nr:uncharacterized protein POJ06DRAFT_262132 [Lipomyces tetrasporus]KAJ8096971.1 hypothetical protein POJ06DRAFT_262132 [Lipomyces tetrasporus]